MREVGVTFKKEQQKQRNIKEKQKEVKAETRSNKEEQQEALREGGKSGQ